MEEKEKFKKPLCIRCGEELKLLRNDNETNEMEFQCTYCGTIELFYPCADEDKENYAWYNDDVDDNLGGCSHGYDGFCPQCGSHIVWGADFMRSEVLGDVENDEDDGLPGILSYCAGFYCCCARNGSCGRTRAWISSRFCCCLLFGDCRYGPD